MDHKKEIADVIESALYKFGAGTRGAHVVKGISRHHSTILIDGPRGPNGPRYFEVTVTEKMS